MAARKQGGGPLAGYRVVGLEQSVAAPLCTRILADLGAEVIKVEHPEHGDFARHWDTHVRGESAQFWWLNLGKQSVALDLKSSAGRRAFDRLLESSAALVHNLSPGAATRLGLGTAEFSARFPRLVECQISGYGSATSYRDRKAYDMLVQAEAGVMSLTGTEETPMRAGVSLSDVATGIYSAVLVLAAFGERDRTGRGRRLDVSMLEATAEFLGPMLLSYLNAGIVYPRVPTRHHSIAPYGAFATSTGEHLLVAIEQDREWRRFCVAVLDRPELADDPRFVTNAARIAHRDALDPIVADVFARLNTDEAADLLDRHDFAYARVNSVDAVAVHPALRERGAFDSVRTNGDEVPSMSAWLVALFQSGQPAPPPALGEHTAELVSPESEVAA